MSPSLLELCHFLQMTLRCIALSTVQLTIHYFRLILMTCSWSNDNLLEFSVQKCKYMIISHKKQLRPHLTTCVSMACHWKECMSTNRPQAYHGQSISTQSVIKLNRKSVYSLQEILPTCLYCQYATSLFGMHKT